MRRASLDSRLLVAAFAACQILSAVACTEHPPSKNGQPLVPIHLPDGAVIRVETARTPSEWARGLMFRTSLPKDGGMLFVLEQDALQQFWMKNTWIDLDIVFLGPDWRIRQISESVPRTTPATPEDQIPNVQGRGRFVLELSAGASRQHRLKVGDALRPLEPSAVADRPR